MKEALKNLREERKLYEFRTDVTHTHIYTKKEQQKEKNRAKRNGNTRKSHTEYQVKNFSHFKSEKDVWIVTSFPVLETCFDLMLLLMLNGCSMGVMFHLVCVLVKKTKMADTTATTTISTNSTKKLHTYSTLHTTLINTNSSLYFDFDWYYWKRGNFWKKKYMHIYVYANLIFR